MASNKASIPSSSWARRAFVGALLALCTQAACGGPPPASANPKRALDERRAIEVMVRAFRDEGVQPVPGRSVELAAGKALQIDVGAQGAKWGAAYLTPGERQKLGDALPPRTPDMGDALQLVRGTGEDADARILILNDTSYLYDDQVGTGHQDTTITAERKLARDVRDFVVRARAEQWP